MINIDNIPNKKKITRLELIHEIQAMAHRGRKGDTICFASKQKDSAPGMVKIDALFTAYYYLHPSIRRKYHSPYWRTQRNAIVDLWYSNDELMDFHIADDNIKALLYGLGYYFGIATDEELYICPSPALPGGGGDQSPTKQPKPTM